MLPRPLAVLSRLIFTIVCVLSSFYCVLAFIPFTYNQVLRPRLIPSLSAFAANQSWYFLGVSLLVFLAALPKRRMTFSLANLALAVFLILRPVLANAPNDQSSLYWAFVFLIPPVWLAVLEWKNDFSVVIWATRPTPSDSRAFSAAWKAALFVTSVSCCMAWMAGRGVTGRDILWIAVGHGALFLLLFALAVGIGGFSAGAFYPARLEFVCFEVLGALLAVIFLSTKVFPAISFSGPAEIGYAWGLGFTSAVSLGSFSLSLYREKDGAVPSGLDLVLLPFTFSVRRRAGAVTVALAVSTALIAAAERAESTFDWNFVLQQITIAFFWLLVFAWLYSGSALRKSYRVLIPLLCVLLTTAAYRFLAAAPNASSASDHIADSSISFRLARDLLPAPAADNSFYGYLSRNSNISRQVEIKPVDLNLVPDLRSIDGPKPHIFVIVIDSLRRDYLSPYNPRVEFTPAIGAFARENVLMRNAFTRYGGTGLSEPSIWSGAMMLHKQYVTPFYPMNTLAKLVNKAGYRSYVSMDTILDVVTPRTPNLVELDKGRLNMDYDACASLGEMASQVEGDVPSFAYTQPQNIHISVITREGKSVPQGETYPGFYAPYASRLRRIDTCFGRFIDTLKRKNLYDSSIVILTADHGDSLGEDGRFGHAYTIFPEIMRIPLIVHLPSSLKASVQYDENRIAFSTDITPSLYYLLGYRNLKNDPLFGRPLFTHTLQEQDQFQRDAYPVAASYAAVYGSLTPDGRRLFISDAVNERDYLYDVETNTPLTLSVKAQADGRKQIRDLIDRIDALYHFTPHE